MMQDTIKPFTPADAKNAKAIMIPNEVIESVNELLAKNYNDGIIILKQNQLIEKIILKMPGLERHEIFERNYLDFEETFRRSGWDVKYDVASGFNESYEAYWRFTKRRVR